ncbi:hypothetical protein [uncultured Maricaulis sp.]|uniref:hypothetical protein n=1 Tax=uncultured Maricaulis sp. TaxID=174710 RepID=UPI0030D8DBC1
MSKAETGAWAAKKLASNIRPSVPGDDPLAAAGPDGRGDCAITAGFAMAARRRVPHASGAKGRKIMIASPEKKY